MIWQVDKATDKDISNIELSQAAYVRASFLKQTTRHFSTRIFFVFPECKHSLLKLIIFLTKIAIPVAKAQHSSTNYYDRFKPLKICHWASLRPEE